MMVRFNPFIIFLFGNSVNKNNIRTKLNNYIVTVFFFYNYYLLVLVSKRSIEVVINLKKPYYTHKYTKNII